MKLSKKILSAMAVAVVVTSGTSCKKDKVDPEQKKGKQQVPYDCPGCGLG